MGSHWLEIKRFLLDGYTGLAASYKLQAASCKLQAASYKIRSNHVLLLTCRL